jgi:hypothetical protein
VDIVSTEGYFFVSPSSLSSRVTVAVATAAVRFSALFQRQAAFFEWQVLQRTN